MQYENQSVLRLKSTSESSQDVKSMLKNFQMQIVSQLLFSFLSKLTTDYRLSL